VREDKAKRRDPVIMNFFSGVLKSAFPTKGLRTSAQKKKVPTITPISTSLDPDLER
jgi:hypothetical protein